MEENKRIRKQLKFPEHVAQAIQAYANTHGLSFSAAVYQLTMENLESKK